MLGLIIRALLSARWGLLSFSVSGGQKKLLGCGLLGKDQYPGWHYGFQGTFRHIEI